MSEFEYVKWNHFSKSLGSMTWETAEITVHFKPLAHVRGTKTSSASAHRHCYSHSYYIQRFFYFLHNFPAEMFPAMRCSHALRSHRQLIISAAFALTSCLRFGAPMHCVPVDLMEFMSECVFAFALSGSGPRKGSHRLRNPKRRPSRTFCAPAEVRDYTRT